MKTRKCDCGCKGTMVDTDDAQLRCYSMHYDRKSKMHELRWVDGFSIAIGHKSGRIISEFHNEATMVNFLEGIIRARVSVLLNEAADLTEMLG